MADGTSKDAAYGNLPLAFEPNHGQTDRRVRFLARGGGYSIFLTGREIVLRFHSPATGTTGGRNAVLRMRLPRTNPTAAIEGLDVLPGRSNYFLGDDPRRWRTDVPNYGKVRYQSVVPGVDLVLYGSRGELEYDWVIAPGVDAGKARMVLQGAKGLHVDEDGDLIAESGSFQARLRKPLAYQNFDGARRDLSARYVLRQGGEVSFDVGTYDKTRTLVIDPVLVYSATFKGGLNSDAGYRTPFPTGGVAVDAADNVYWTGITNSAEFPTVNPMQGTIRSGVDIFVAKLNASGTAFLYSTFLGATGEIYGSGGLTTASRGIAWTLPETPISPASLAEASPWSIRCLSARWPAPPLSPS